MAIYLSRPGRDRSSLLRGTMGHSIWKPMSNTHFMTPYIDLLAGGPAVSHPIIPRVCKHRASWQSRDSYMLYSPGSTHEVQ
jgi:hypothetical protein